MQFPNKKVIKGFLIRSVSESIESSSLSLKRVDNVHSSNSLSLSVIGVGNGISNDSSQEFLEDISNFLVDTEGDSLDTSSSGKSSDGRFSNSLNNWSRSTSSSDSLFRMNFSISFSTFSGLRSHNISQL